MNSLQILCWNVDWLDHEQSQSLGVLWVHLSCCDQKTLFQPGPRRLLDLNSLSTSSSAIVPELWVCMRMCVCVYVTLMSYSWLSIPLSLIICVLTNCEFLD